ncbi:MAG TPA: NUDIX domain-containing protein [Paenalcaligenes sp.]|nr:NUDIX domain-containing protein [Paenalcaligenes sp.]
MDKAQIQNLLPQFERHYDALIAQTQEFPPDGSRPVTVCGRLCGWVSAAALECLAELAGVKITEEAVHIAWADEPSPRVDHLLAHIAQVLNEQGLVKSWRDELLEVIGEGQVVGAIERGVMRPLGFLTQAVHLNAWGADDQLWIAKRAPHKNSDPNFWDTLVGGLAAAGEDLETTLLRETQEEAGLTAEQVHDRGPVRTLLRMHRRLPEGYLVENVVVSNCQLADDTQPVNQDGEVSDIRLVSVPEWWEMAQAGEFTLESQLIIIDSIRARFASRTQAA